MDGKVFDLKTMGQQSDSNNTLLERIKRDVSDDRANTTHHSYTQNSEEFKVHVLNDTPADLFDSLPARKCVHLNNGNNNNTNNINHSDDNNNSNNNSDNTNNSKIIIMATIIKVTIIILVQYF